MQMDRNNLRYMTSVQHQGLAFLLGIDSDRDIYYSVRPIPPPADRAAAGEEEDAMSDAATAVSSPYSQWQDWLRLPLPADTADDSVVEQERQAGTDVWVRSGYDTARRTALAPIQALSDGEHLFVLRQSQENTLLVDRFLLDGGTQRLVSKLEVRFKRSRQRFTPARPQGLGGKRTFDTTDFRDFAGNFFFEPTQEIRFVENLTQGRFTAALASMTEHDVSRCHIFAYNAASRRIDLYSIRRSRERLFELEDYSVEEGTIEAPEPRQIPGLIKRTLVLRGVDGQELISI